MKYDYSISVALSSSSDFCRFCICRYDQTDNTCVVNILIKTTFTRHRHILKKVKNLTTVAEFGLAFTRFQHDFKKTENSTIANSVQSLQEFDPKEMYLHFKNCLVSF